MDLEVGRRPDGGYVWVCTRCRRGGVVLNPDGLDITDEMVAADARRHVCVVVTITQPPVG